MKKIGIVFCVIVVMFVPFIFASCNKNKKAEINLFEQVKEIFVASDMNEWDGFSATRVDENGQEKILLNKLQSPFFAIASTKKESVNVNFVLENETEKIFCENNIRYYVPKTSTRKYIDETDFDGETFINEIFKSNLKEFFDYLNGNGENTVSVDIKQENKITIYEIKILLNKNRNKILNVVIKKLDNKIIYVSLTIENELNVEVFESDEIVSTPNWFDNNDFKSEISYEEAETFSQNVTFKDWKYAKILAPTFFDENEGERNVYIGQNFSWSECVYNDKYDNYNRVYKDETFYTYFNDGQQLNPLPKNSFYKNEKESNSAYLYDINSLDFIKNFTFNLFFNQTNKNHYTEYFNGAKKYEKDIDVISYRFNTNENYINNIKFDCICSLFYDLEGNLFKIECYVSQDDASEGNNNFEGYYVCEKLDGIDMPTWFNENDFA